MNPVILKATFGDNLAQRDVTNSVQKSVEGGNVKVTANEGLIPAFDVSKETKLTNEDLMDINKKAQEKCEGGADTACMQAAKAEFTQLKHEEKARTDTSSSNIIAGRRMEVTYRDSQGNTKRAVVPEGQVFEMDNVAFETKGKIERPQPFSWISKSFYDAAGIFWWTLLFVFSVAAAYRVFKIYGNIVLALFIGFLAVILPLAGYSPQVGVYMIIVLFGIIEMGKMSKQKSMAEAGAPPAVAAVAAPAPSVPSDPLAAFQGATGSVNNLLGNLQGAAGLLKNAKANPMALVGSFLGKR
jgi:hypothetical protein